MFFDSNIPILLVGNKADELRSVDLNYHDIKNFASINNMHYIEVSAKYGTCINDIFIEIILLIEIKLQFDKTQQNNMYDSDELYEDDNYIFLNDKHKKNKQLEQPLLYFTNSKPKSNYKIDITRIRNFFIKWTSCA